MVDELKILLGKEEIQKGKLSVIGSKQKLSSFS